MSPCEVSRLLRCVQKKYKGQKTDTGEVVISDMAKDAADTIDELLAKIDEMEAKQCIMGVDLARGPDIGLSFPYIQDLSGEKMPKEMRHE